MFLTRRQRAKLHRSEPQLGSLLLADNKTASRSHSNESTGVRHMPNANRKRLLGIIAVGDIVRSEGWQSRTDLVSAASTSHCNRRQSCAGCKRGPDVAIGHQLRSCRDTQQSAHLIDLSWRSLPALRDVASPGHLPNGFAVRGNLGGH